MQIDKYKVEWKLNNIFNEIALNLTDVVKQAQFYNVEKPPKENFFEVNIVNLLCPFKLTIIYLLKLDFIIKGISMSNFKINFIIYEWIYLLHQKRVN